MDLVNEINISNTNSSSLFLAGTRFQAVGTMLYASGTIFGTRAPDQQFNTPEKS